MNAGALLDQALALFQEGIDGADFRRAFPPAPGGRLPQRPVVAGAVEAETVKNGSQEVRLRFRIFLPEGAGPSRAEELFAAMCQVVRERFPSFSAMSRGAAERERATGLLAVTCTLSFSQAESAGDGGSSSGETVVLGGVEYQVTGIKTTFTPLGTDLVAVGETAPFATLRAGTEYTVELEGLETAGLDRLAAFTAQAGGQTYTGCRWKYLSDGLRKAAFVSRERGLAT